MDGPAIGQSNSEVERGPLPPDIMRVLKRPSNRPKFSQKVAPVQRDPPSLPA